MRSLCFNRYALGVSMAGTMLSACGGLQAPINVPLSAPIAGPAALRVQNSNYRIVYSFKGAPDGALPTASLIYVLGKGYGTTFHGGANAYGTVYSTTPSGAETVIHSFVGSPGDGALPYAALINIKGTLYGTTQEGGANNGGTVFSITPSGAETVLHSFSPQPPDGYVPVGSLINVNGTLYGTTMSGGASGNGTVFKITPSGTETVIHNFTGSPSDGLNPFAGLLNVNGMLYGTTGGGGTYNDGTVFAIRPSGAERVIHSFAGSDGDFPYAALINVNGTLYGTTSEGGANGYGTVYSIKLSGAETVIHSFAGRPHDGAEPRAKLTQVKGELYSTTFEGGAKNHGTVYSITPSGTETVLHSFVVSGGYPYAGVVNHNGTLYGTSSAGGLNNFGAVYRLTP